MTIDFAAFDIDPVTGFLPSPDPQRRLPASFEPWDALGAELPALLLAGQLRRQVQSLEVLDSNWLQGKAQLERAMLLLTTLSSAYVWGEPEPASRLPQGLAIPLWRVAERLGRKPIINHGSNVLSNWRRLDPGGPIELENLAMLQGFLTSSDEAWFVLVTVAVEAHGAAALPQLVRAQQAVVDGDANTVLDGLERIAAIIGRITGTLERMYEKCDPHVFYRSIRPFVAGWNPPGLIYEGVSETPVMLAGGSAAQSSLVQALDAGLGVQHRSPDSQPFLLEMRHYMPPMHKAFIEALERGPNLRTFVQGRSDLLEGYNACVERLSGFRRAHIEIAVRYITHQASGAARGTGGTDFTRFLGVARKETEASKR